VSNSTGLLSIPEIDPEQGLIHAALKYASAGWYVIPVEPESKMPSKRFRHWAEASSRDPEEIVGWFTGTSDLLAIHAGRSGAVIFDVDDPDIVPERLSAHFTKNVPFQSTRVDRPGRGHYVFAQPEGRMLGNSRGELGTSKWGEIRGTNAIIVVSPSTHTKKGGRYQWMQHGPVPVLPADLANALPDYTGKIGSASNKAVQAFLAAHISQSDKLLLRAVIDKFRLEAKNGRHEALVAHLAQAMREAAMGFYSAQNAVDELRIEWNRVMVGEANFRKVSEFESVLSWAVGAALDLLGDPDKLASRKLDIEKRIADTKIMPELDAPKATAYQPELAFARPERPSRPPTRDVEDYFDKAGPKVALIAEDVQGLSLIRVGEDNTFWKYLDGGVWVRDKGIVTSRCVTLLANRFRNGHAAAVNTVVQYSVPRLKADPTEEHMNFLNGMLEWRTGKMVPHSPDFCSTVQFPHEWQPDETECPMFDKFLESVLEPDYVQIAWEMIGYLMMSGNPLQKAFMLVGTGGNGKGTLIRVIEDILGRHNCASQSLDALKNRFAPATLHGKIANIAGDIDKTYQESTAQFKGLTGEDTLSAEYKYGDSFMFRNWAVPVFSANAIPGSADTSKGYLRRWVPIMFNRTISDDKAKPGLSLELSQEAPAIMTKAVAALRVMMERNHGKGAFHTSQEIQEGLEDFAKNIDQIRMWLDSEKVVVREEVHQSRTDLFAAYKAWAQENHYGMLSSGEFYRRLSGINGIREVKIRGNRHFRGVAIVETTLIERGRTVRQQGHLHAVNDDEGDI